VSDLGVFGIGVAIGLLIIAAVLWTQRAQVCTSWRQLKRGSGQDSDLLSLRGGKAWPVWFLSGVTALVAGVGFASGALLVAIPNSVLCAASILVAIRLGPSTDA
jgi:uncharacterized membrane protein YciS (DUF1049 family)